MFKHILVPTDLTDRDRKALDIAMKMGLENGAKITLLHVIETIEGADSEDFRKFFNQLGVRADKKMDQIIDRITKDDLGISKQVLFGRRVYEILDFAQSKAVDLIIMSSHRLDMDGATEGWGTISFKVGVLAHCPVMLVK